MQFEYECVTSWPPLAWLAKVPQGSYLCRVRHGRRVETRPDWFCEAVWPGDFDAGDFDETDLVAGSGARIRQGRIRFVSSGNTVDRLLWVSTAGSLWVSNSLACLLAATGGRVDPSYPRYYEDFSTTIKGLGHYKRSVRTSVGDVGIQLFGYIDWDGDTVTTSFKPVQRRDFSDFARYESFLRSNMEALAHNAAAPGRQTKLRLLATVSAGYDSATCAALAARAGCTEALCIDKDRLGELEHGDQVARSLRLRPTMIQREAWHGLDRPEVLFMSADGEAESVPLASAAAALDGAVLLTGYHGDKIWAKDTKDLSEDIVRGDHSGLSLTEFRLWTGFIHCPITFWGVRQIADIHRISNSDEMSAWDVGGGYTRPIPRRIIEGAGVARNLFGVAKRASAVGLSEFLSERSMADYTAWLTRRRRSWLAHGRMPPILGKRYERLASRVFHSMTSVLRALPMLWRLAPDTSLERPSGLRRYVFPWALEQVIQRYRDAEPGTVPR